MTAKERAKPEPARLTVTAHEADQRLDRFLRKLLRAVPLGAIFRRLREGAIRVDGARAEPSLRLREGMEIELRLPAADLADAARAPRGAEAQQERRQHERERERGRGRGRDARGVPREGPRVVHRDADVLVIDKPAGMAAQPGTPRRGAARAGDDVVAWLDREGLGARSATFAPAPAHRLDRGTSGLLAIGLSPAGLRGLTAAFREDRVEKVYLAVVHGVPRAAHGTIDAPLREVRGADPHAPKTAVAAADDPDAKPAHTEWEVVRAQKDRALLRVVPRTGRQHQIRAHLAFLGHPIVGDRRYGSPVRLGAALLLHAAELRLPHPVTGEPLDLRAEPPPAFRLGGAP